MNVHRRNFLSSLFAAPAIVAYQNIMPVKLIDWRLEGWVPIDPNIMHPWPNHLEHLISSMRLSKEWAAADLLNEMEQ